MTRALFSAAKFCAGLAPDLNFSPSRSPAGDFCDPYRYQPSADASASGAPSSSSPLVPPAESQQAVPSSAMNTPVAQQKAVVPISAPTGKTDRAAPAPLPGPLAGLLTSAPFRFQFRSTKNKSVDPGDNDNNQEKVSEGTMLVDYSANLLFMSASTEALKKATNSAKPLSSEVLIHGNELYSRMRTGKGEKCLKFRLVEEDDVPNGHGLSGMIEADGPTVQPGERRFRQAGGGLSAGVEVWTDDAKERLIRLGIPEQGVVVEVENWGRVGVTEVDAVVREFGVDGCVREPVPISRRHWLLAQIFLA